MKNHYYHYYYFLLLLYYLEKVSLKIISEFLFAIVHHLILHIVNEDCIVVFSFMEMVFKNWLT